MTESNREVPPVVPSVVPPQPPPVTPPTEAALDALLARLNPEQQHVASWRPAHGNLRVVAAAGSGKTTTTVALVGNLLRAGVNPHTLVVTTFTNRAGAELRERLARVVRPAALDALRVGTFHSLAMRALRGDSRFPQGRNVDGDNRAEGVYAAMTLWSRACNSNPVPGLNVLGTGVGDEAVREYPLVIESLCRSHGLSVSDAEAIDRLKKTGLPSIHEVWRLYEDQKRMMGAHDFHDLLMGYYEQVRTQPGGSVVIVDEAQDNNLVQLGIALALAGEQGRVVLVGDVRQSIYEWRGAAPQLFLGADQSIGAQTAYLSTNYRSGSSIIEVGNRVAEGRPWSLGPPAGTGRVDADGTPFEGEVSITSHDSDLDEAKEVSVEIAAMLKDGVKPEDVAILCRTRAQQGGYEASLLARRIPVVVVGGSSYFASADWKDFMATLACAAGEATAEEVVRLVRAQRGCGFKVGSEAQQAFERNQSVDEAFDGAVAVAYAQATKAALRTLQRRLAEVRTLDLKTQAERVAEWLVAESSESMGDDDRRGAMVTAAGIAARFEDVAAVRAFAARCAGATRAAPDRAQATQQPGGRVTISTIHRAKGLEWGVVYVSATSGLFPHARSVDDEARLEEERRLFYVAATRARDVLRLTWAKVAGRHAGGPSEFLDYAEEPKTPTPPTDGSGSGPGPSHDTVPLTAAQQADLASVEADLNEVAVKHHGDDVLLALDEQGQPVDLRSVEPTDPPRWSPRSLRSVLGNPVAHERAEALTQTAPPPAPGSRFVQVTLGDFETLLGAYGFRLADDLTGRSNQRVLTCPLSDGGRVVVYTTVPRAGQTARGLGEDSIKVALLDNEGRPRAKRLPYAARTSGWRMTLLRRLVDVLGQHPDCREVAS